MSDNWVVQNLQNALDTWNSKLAEIWQILTQSPENFKGGGIWQVIVQIHEIAPNVKNEMPIGSGILRISCSLPVSRFTIRKKKSKYL